MLPDYAPSRQLRRRDVYRSGRMVLHPLAEVRIGVLMTIVVGGRQFVVHILCNGKGSQGENETDEGPYHSGARDSQHRVVVRHRSIRVPFRHGASL
jgi:hypothetical protein